MKQATDCIVIVGYVYTPENELETEIVRFLQGENRRIIPAKEIEYYKTQLLNCIASINLEYSYQPSVHAEFHNPGYPSIGDDFTLAFQVKKKNKLLVGFTIYSSTKK